MLFAATWIKGQREDIKALKTELDICVADTKDCNVSIASLSTRIAHLDNTFGQVHNRIDIISERTHAMDKAITALETHQKAKRGGD